MNAAKKGLGRGLSALFGDVEVKSSSIDLNTNSLPIADLERNKYQPRSIFDNEKLDELSSSIKKNGIIQPIAVRPNKNEKGKIEIEALTYIRGRSINNAFMIIDEAQNLTAHEVKTIITRVGENTKVVLTGDIEQIDNLYTNETSNGLTYAVERFKEYNLAGHVTFTKGERSRIATLASKIL